VAEPSYCQNAPCTFLPEQRVTLSSIATTIGASGSTSVAMMSRASTMPTWCCRSLILSMERHWS
jgi:hypothetical protein